MWTENLVRSQSSIADRGFAYDAVKIRVTPLGLSVPVYKVETVMRTLECPHYLMLLLFLQRVTPFKTLLEI